MIDNDKETLFLSDDLVFYTIEGEGEYIGQPSVFMRMSMCNLTCIGFASEDSPNGCDSYVSWSVKNKKTFTEVFQLMEDNNYTEHLRHNAILKLTGGEPFIQEKQLLKFIEAFRDRYHFIPRIDFETNATLMFEEIWVKKYKATFTTSPKMSSNGDPEEKTYVPEVLNWHIKQNSCFKFVVTGEKDVEELFRKYITSDKVKVPKHLIWLMVCAGSRKEHIENAAYVAELCKECGFNFSPRLQLILWDKALRV